MTAHPLRQQRSRRKGSTTPPGVRYAGRPTVLGNPFRADLYGHARATKLHRAWLTGQLSFRTLRSCGFNDDQIVGLQRLRARALNTLADLRGVPLQCWCPLSSRWCHVDTVLALANK